jgi:hypothetical protein
MRPCRVEFVLDADDERTLAALEDLGRAQGLDRVSLVDLDTGIERVIWCDSGTAELRREAGRRRADRQTSQLRGPRLR